MTTRLRAADVRSLDPYAFFASLGKRVIHPGGRRATEELLSLAAIEPGHRVLDVGCGVATTAIEIAERHGARVTAVDISPLMLERARDNVRHAGASGSVEVRSGDILALEDPEGTYDRVIAEAVTMFVDRPRAARELVRVCRPGGRVLATEFLWRRRPSEEARQAFLGQLCTGMSFDTLEDWTSLYRSAGLEDVAVASGPFEMMSARGFLADEGLRNSVAVVGRVLARPVNLRKMTYVAPRVAKAVPYLGYVVIAGTKP